jgi:hypothetical protein
VELVVERKDSPQAGPQSKILEYRFPRDVGKNQIQPDDSPLPTIDFELVPRDNSENGTKP